MAETSDLPAEIRAKAETTVSWELAHQWNRAWIAIKWGFSAFVALSFLLVIGQMYLFYNLFADIHPALGIMFVLVVTLLLALLVGRPLLSFFDTPVAALPPPPPQNPAEPSKAEILARLKYDLKYLKSLSKNPALHADIDTIKPDLARGNALLADLKSRSDFEPVAARQSVEKFERDHIESRLKSIDADVERLIHNEAVGVGVATAVSMNGTVDAFIVLWRNANLVSRIARMYFGRPHLKGSLLILRDVAAIVVLSRALEDVTDLTGEVMGGLLGRMGGVLAGPVMDGGINAMMTLKLGYLAKRRCRSFESWSLKQAGSISRQAMEGVKRESASVIAELVKASGGITRMASRAGEKAWKGSKSAWSYMQGWFGPKAEKPEQA